MSSQRQDCLERDGVWDQTREMCHLDQDGPDIINEDTSDESHGIAVIAGILFPGGGQLVNGYYTKAFLILITSWLIIPYIYGIVEASRGQ
jgi:hypothetical protein